jgi:hypothetical protein
MKAALKAPGIKLLKLKFDKSLSNFACKFNLRRYIKGRRNVRCMQVGLPDLARHVLGCHLTTQDSRVQNACR